MPTETPKQRYLFGVALLAEGQHKSALRQFKEVLDEDPDLEVTMDAKFQIGRALMFHGRYKKAFRHLERFLEKYPASRLDAQVLRTMYKIARKVMEDRPSRAVAMFEKIVERNPYGELADDAQLSIGDCYFKKKDYETARAMYKALLDDYRDSEWAPVATFQMAECDLSETEYTWDTGTLMPRALDSYREYVRKYPNGRDVERAKRRIAEVRDLHAKNQFDIAEFYLRIKKPGAAATYMRAIQRQHPDSHWAGMARDGVKYLQALRVVK